MIVALAVLLLQPVLADDGPLRLVAADVGDEEVTWTLDGVEVARTGDREAVVVNVSAGVHELRASGPERGPWHALARPDGTADGAAFVAGWSASHDPVPRTGDGSPWWSWLPPLHLALGAAALVLLAWPARARARAGLRRTKGP